VGHYFGNALVLGHYYTQKWKYIVTTPLLGFEFELLHSTYVMREAFICHITMPFGFLFVVTYIAWLNLATPIVCGLVFFSRRPPKYDEMS
jgi:hypothetical protein